MMKLDDINRASDARNNLLRVKDVWRCLASETNHALVSAPTGSFDGVTGKDYCVEVVLRGVARVEVRRVLKQEYERLAALLVEFGVEVPQLD